MLGFLMNWWRRRRGKGEEVQQRYNMTSFTQQFGFEPALDDLDRVNCHRKGLGHLHCGVCSRHNLPRIYCHCQNR